MFHDATDVETWLQQWDTFGIKLGLQRMEWMLEELDHPEHYLKAIHVGGTNGKGSTVAFIDHILREANYKVGRFTSPAIATFNDRISVDGAPISDEHLKMAVEMVKPVTEKLSKTNHGAPTEFEVITIIAIVYFAKINPCDLVLFEVGLGGRHDSTNVIKPLLSVITNVGHDHMKQLGNTLGEIAYEKAGIIKQGVPLITSIKEEEALKVVKETATSLHAKVYKLNEAFKLTHKESLDLGERFDLKTPFHNYEDLVIHMSGHHQIENASLAVMVMEYLRTFYAFNIKESDIQEGLKRAFWPARFEKVSDNPIIILDGAHNIEGMQALVRTLQEHYSDYKITTLYATLADKEHAKLLNELGKVSTKVVLTSFDFKRALKPEDVLQYMPKHIQPKIMENWKEAITNLSAGLNDDELLLVTGTLYFVTRVRDYFKQKK